MLLVMLFCDAGRGAPCSRLRPCRVSCRSWALRWQSAPWLQLLLQLLLLCTSTPECIWAIPKHCRMLYLSGLVMMAVRLRWPRSLSCLRWLRRRHNVRRL